MLMMRHTGRSRQRVTGGHAEQPDEKCRLQQRQARLSRGSQRSNTQHLLAAASPRTAAPPLELRRSLPIFILHP